MAQAEIRTNMDTVVVNVQKQFDRNDPALKGPAKFKYVGSNPSSDMENGVQPHTTVFGQRFERDKAVEVNDPLHIYKLRGNPHFQEVGGKKDSSRVPEDSRVDPESQGMSADEESQDARRGQNYETMRDTPTVLDLPNPLSKEQQELADEKDREAGRKPEADKKRK
jgi:hypothetical protein